MANRRFASLFLTVAPMMLVLLLLLRWILYSIVRSMVDMAGTQERNRILEIEECQYRKLQAYMGKSAAVRHDFRHVVSALDDFLSAGDSENAAKYLKAYIVAMPKNEMSLLRPPDIECGAELLRGEHTPVLHSYENHDEASGSAPHHVCESLQHRVGYI